MSTITTSPKTNSKEFRSQVQQHIIDIFNEEYEIEGDSISQKVMNSLKSTHDYLIKRIGEQKAFMEWVMGLPGVISIEFYYGEVNKVLDSWGLDSSKYDDSKNFEFYLYLIYREVSKLKPFNLVDDTYKVFKRN